MTPLSAEPPQPVTRLDPLDVEMLELRRHRAIDKRNRRILVSAAIVTVVIAISAYAFSPAFWEQSHFYIIVFFTALGLHQWTAAAEKEYIADFKSVILPAIAKSFGMKFKQDGGIPLSRVQYCPIIPPYDKMHTEDLIYGTYKGAKIYMSELDMWQKRQRLDNREDEREVFSGLAMLIELPRVTFDHDTIVVPKNMMFSAWLQNNLRGMKHVDLVDPHFERKYRAYGRDQIESRFLLHPAMVERIERLSHPLVMSRVSVAFTSGCVLVMIPLHKNLFEPPPMAMPATDSDTIRMLEHELQQALGLVDAFEFYRPQP